MSEQEKKQIREMVLRKRGQLFTTGDAKRLSTIIMDRLKEEPRYREAKTIFCFVSFGTEVMTHEFIQQALAEGKRVFVPYIKTKKEGMKASEIYDFSELEVGYFNILSPKPEYLRLTDERPDLVVVPGVAFSKDGYRVGYGGGFYDRYLGYLNNEGSRIGVAFQAQVVDQVPVEDFDVPIDKLITEKESYNFWHRR